MHVAAPLESLVAQQAATIDKLSAEREQYRKLYLELLERCAMLERGIIVGKNLSGGHDRIHPVAAAGSTGAT